MTGHNYWGEEHVALLHILLIRGRREGGGSICIKNTEVCILYITYIPYFKYIPYFAYITNFACILRTLRIYYLSWGRGGRYASRTLTCVFSTYIPYIPHITSIAYIAHITYIACITYITSIYYWTGERKGGSTNMHQEHWWRTHSHQITRESYNKKISQMLEKSVEWSKNLSNVGNWMFSFLLSHQT